VFAVVFFLVRVNEKKKKITRASQTNGVGPWEGHGGGLRADGSEASLTSTDSGVHSSVGTVGVGTASDVAVVLV
jgi:hypothetical protein